MFAKLLTSLVLVQLAAAQYDYGPNTPTGSAAAAAPSAPPDTAGHHNINVAAGGNFIFSPANITANVGDIVTFYYPGGQIPHSVTQSSFSQPCTHLAANGSTPAGFDSSLQLAKTFSINITDTNPIWFHCKQILHCGEGMVGSINAPINGTNTHDAYVAVAKAIGNNEITEVDGSPVLSGVHATPLGAAADTTTSAPASSSGSRIAVGTALLVVAAGITTFSM